MIDDDDEEIPISKDCWSRDAVCSCAGKGEPIMLQGQMVICRDPACRVHSTTLSPTQTPQSVETILGNFSGREIITK